MKLCKSSLNATLLSRSKQKLIIFSLLFHLLKSMLLILRLCQLKYQEKSISFQKIYTFLSFQRNYSKKGYCILITSSKIIFLWSNLLQIFSFISKNLPQIVIHILEIMYEAIEKKILLAQSMQMISDLDLFLTIYLIGRKQNGTYR